MKWLTVAELEILLGRLPGLRVGVLGDFALDCYWPVAPAAAQHSVETGRLTRPVAGQRYAPGAAGNVVVNLLALGCGRVSAFGVLGRDPWGAELRRLLRARKADTTGLPRQAADWETVAYVKPHRRGVEQNRFDFGDFNRLHDDVADQLVQLLADALPGLDAVVVNAQARAGIHSAYLRRRLAALIGRHTARLFIVDSRERGALYPGCLLKINNLEAARCTGRVSPAGGALSRRQSLAAAAALFAERDRPVFVTCGARGMLVQDQTGVTEVPAIPLGAAGDTTGAGDAALAGITAALASGAPPVAAAGLGTLAAAVCVGKLRQTGTASPDEIRALLRRRSG
ncbi:MAG: hypothetical protein K9N49_00395 [Candidatus Marinimicrobia bacterium]|nr:hypothetical protein [Candidatus Neomarinimicrobiota bacterium]